MPPSAPEPIHILRTQTAQAAVLAFSPNNARLYAGDVTGRVVVTATRALRPLAVWAAHDAGMLGLEEWAEEESGWTVITHGRDNKLKVWLLKRTADDVGASGTAAGIGEHAPELRTALDVNALNFCRFSLVRSEAHTLVAVPNLVDSSFTDVWELSSGARVHAAIGKEGQTGVSEPFADGRGGSGILMALRLFQVSHPSSSSRQLRLLTAYEDGSVALRATDQKTSVEGAGWDKLWTAKLHVESVMAMAVTLDGTLALSVSADHIIGRYNLLTGETTVHRTKHPGNGAIALRDDGRVCAVAGWDGKVRLYSTKSIKPLGTLAYHKEACQAVAFAHNMVPVPAKSQGGRDDDGDDDDEKEERAQWLASGGKDGRIALWPLMDFEGGRS